MLIRKALPSDIPEMHRVRLAVSENRLTRSVITEDDYRVAITTSGCGWIAEIDGVLRGFAVGDRDASSIWALFVEPGFETQGMGRALHTEMMQWMRAAGCMNVWLVTEPGTRAESFYRKAGWRFIALTAEGDARFEMNLA